ncbi:MAG: MATE family efflux transporter [Deltaproteobacteria bacterium]|nr:MATE family efflux transporter [Deltaproteobacteria bacterium]
MSSLLSGIAPAADRRRRILVLALPIVGGMASQNVLNLVDTAMVGVLGDEALAAVGLGGMANFLLTSFILGLSAGVQATAARRVGQGRDSETAVPLNGGLVIALSVAIPWSVVLWFVVPSFFPLLVDDPAVYDQGIPYLQARLLAMVAMGMNYCFRGYWNATDRSALYMKTLVVMHVTNVFLNCILIYGSGPYPMPTFFGIEFDLLGPWVGPVVEFFGIPRLGAEGAGLASASATWAGTITYVFLGFRHARGGGFLRALPSRETIVGMVRLSLPNGIQTAFYAGGMVAFYVLTGMVGTRELAAANVIINLLLVGILPGIAFGFAGMSLVGQALGRGEPEDAMRWGWDVAKTAAMVVFLIAIPGMIAPHFILGFFLHDPETLHVAELPLRMVSFFLAFDAMGMVFLNCLLGAGATRSVMGISVTLQWFFFLPLVALVGPVLDWGLVAIYGANILYRAIQTGLFAAIWKRGRWAKIEV